MSAHADDTTRRAETGTERMTLKETHMEASTSDAIIDLTADEGAAFLGRKEATPAMLADSNHPAGAWRSFRERVEHAASELHYATDRTVLVCMDGEDEPVARYGYHGLTVEKE